MASATSGMASVAAVTMTIAVITPAAYPPRPAPDGRRPAPGTVRPRRHGPTPPARSDPAGTVRSGAVRSGAVRSGAVRFGAVRSGAVRSGAVGRERGRARRRLTPRPWCRPTGPVRRRRGRVGGGLGRLWDGLVGGVTESLCERSQEALDTVVRLTGRCWERSHGVAAVTPIRSLWPWRGYS